MSPWPPEGEPQGKGTKAGTRSRAPGTPTSPASSSTTFDDVRNVRSSAPRRATPQSTWRRARVAKALLGAIVGIEVAGSTLDEAGLRKRVDAAARAERDTVGG